MKVGNKLLNRVVAVAMLAVVVLSSVSVSFADLKTDYDGIMSSNAISTLKDDWTSPNNKNFHREYSVQGSSNVYLMCIGGVYWLVSKENFSVNQVTKLDDGSVYSESSLTVSPNKCNHYNFYSVQLSFHCDRVYAPCAVFDYDTWVNLNKNNSSKYDTYPNHVIGAFLFDVYFMEYVKIENSKAEGSADNPIHKDDFGYPDIYNSTYIHNDPNNLETLDKLYSGQDFQWNRKTTTGFDLTNNDYNYTYIECKVKANYQYNDRFSGKGDWHNFDSYGEMGNLGKVRAESLTHYYTFQELTETLPKTYDELPDHKMRAINFSAVYYFRVVCMKTSSTVVIPDEKDCKYYAGPWRSVNVTKLNGKDGKSIIEDGDFDENGEWKKDDDSADNGKDIDNGSTEGDDLSDASDKAHETINSNANKSTLDLDSAKAFINQVADVPKMIADIFSFLPDWVKYSFAFGFALIPIIIIYKLIRG